MDRPRPERHALDHLGVAVFRGQVALFWSEAKCRVVHAENRLARDVVLSVLLLPEFHRKLTSVSLKSISDAQTVFANTGDTQMRPNM